jgi:hypothetical protein
MKKLGSHKCSDKELAILVNFLLFFDFFDENLTKLESRGQKPCGRLTCGRPTFGQLTFG